MAGKPYTSEKRLAAFWSRVNKTDTCWLWTGATNKPGYGKFHNGSCVEMAHRYSWTLANGPIPAGLWVLHRCDVPACVHPEHLFLGTCQDNAKDCYHKGRSALSKYNSPENVADRIIRTGYAGKPRKLTPTLVRKIRHRYFTKGESQPKIADSLGINQTMVSAIVTGKTWKHVS